MGTFNIKILASTTEVFTVDSEDITNCYSEKVITVDTTTGNKHIQIVTSDTYGSPSSLTEIISSDKTYALRIEGDNLSGTSINSSIVVIIRDQTATGVVQGRTSLLRDHSGNIC